MTRQNVTDGPREVMTRKCPTCSGDGVVLSETTTAIDVERKLRELASGSRAKAFRVEVNARVAALVVGPGGQRLTELEERTKRRLFLVGKEDVHLDHVAVLEQGTVEQLTPAAPVAEDAELQLELGEVGLHDPSAAVGKVDGYAIEVAGAAKLVGKKVKVKIARVLDGTAYATLLRPAPPAPETPITAEAEAEKPTRAPRRKKAEEAAPAAEKPAADEVVAEEEAPAEEVKSEDAVAEDGQRPKPKKKTRRGSRGGRGRKRKPAAAAAQPNGDAAPAEPAPEPQEAGAAQPVATIHVPEPDLGQSEADGEVPEDGEEQPKPRKKTRRGSRGGRNRRRKPAAASGAAPGEPEPKAEAG
jgi:ribonuclease G